MRPGRTLLVLLLLALGAARPALAHTHLAGSTPAADDTVDAGVREIRLRFSQAPEASLTWLAVLRGGDTLASGAPRPVPGTRGREFVLEIPALRAGGAYQVAWRTAGADGHVLHGSFGFTVRAAAAPVEPAATAAAPAQAAPAPGGSGEEAPGSGFFGPAALVRWAGFLGLLGMIGAPAFYLAVIDRMRRRGGHEGVTARAAYAAWYVASGAAALSVLTLVLRLWVQSAEVYGSAEALAPGRLAALLQTTAWGSAWTLQAVATLGFFLGLMIARAPHGRGAGWAGAGAAAALLCAVPALSGHAASVEGATALAIATDSLHVLGAGIWLGTLAVMAAAGLPAALSRAEGGGAAALSAMVNAFSPVALLGAALAGATGVGNALFHVGAVSDLWTTPYGQALALKLLLLVGVAASGAYNWRRVRPALLQPEGAARLRRSVTAELVIGALVLAVTAVLVALPPP